MDAPRAFLKSKPIERARFKYTNLYLRKWVQKKVGIIETPLSFSNRVSGMGWNSKMFPEWEIRQGGDLSS